MTTRPPERQQTDDSLKTERANTDHELARKRGVAEKVSDAVIARAAERADEIVHDARAKADASTDGASAAVKSERRGDDLALAEERQADAEQLAAEREVRKRVLAELLRHERDVTDRDLLTERRGADRALGSRDEFLGIVSHDLRTLVASTALAAELLVMETSPDDARVLKRANVIRRNAARMNRLLCDLLDIVSIEAKQLAVTPSLNDLAIVIGESLEVFAPLAAVKSMVVVADRIPSAISAHFDHDRILQVLGNLLSNSLKFAPEGGRVEISAVCGADEICCTVADTGPGIPSEMLQTIFEPFRQVKAHDRRGLGLGLHISRCIVEAHGGRIWAESTFGEGAAFHFTLPQKVVARL